MTASHPQHSAGSLPFPPPTAGSQHVDAARRANGAAAADLQVQRCRVDILDRLSPLDQAHAKVNGVIQRVDTLWRILADHLSDYRARVNEDELRHEQIFGTLSQHDDELVEVRRRLAELESGRRAA